MVFTMIEEASRRTHYNNTIQPFKRSKNGRGAWSMLISSHVGGDKWESITKQNSTWIMSTKWMGKSYSLEVFCSQHRAKNSQIEEVALHVPFQVSGERTRVGYLLDNIKHQNTDLRTAIAQIRTNSSSTRNDFDKSVSILLPVDPYIKTPDNKKVSFEVSLVGATKFDRGKRTGVSLRWNKNKNLPHSTRMRNPNCMHGRLLWKVKIQLKKPGTLTSERREFLSIKALHVTALTIRTTLIRGWSVRLPPSSRKWIIRSSWQQ